MLVTKRDGSLQPLDLEKLHAVLEWACNGKTSEGLGKIKGVSVSQIEMKAKLHLYNKIPTKQIHETVVRAAADLISEDTPNYDQVAARLRWFAVRKEAFKSNTPPPIYDIIKRNTKRGLYDPDVLRMYSREEWETINTFIDHVRDDLFRHAGAEQMFKKYLVQNRKTKQIYETFQIPYILVSAILFSKYPVETRLSFVKRFYDLISEHYISLPTPIMAGLRTRQKQFSSCTLIDSGDSLESINATSSAIVTYASNKAGIGVNLGRIRAEGQLVRGGDAVTTGVIPFAKYFAAALKSCSQGAVRGASATFTYPLWHHEYPHLIELKNNKGTDETRIRVVDYSVQLNRTMYERLVSKGNITFFSPDEVPDLYEAFFDSAQKFKELYEKYEVDSTKTKFSKPASEVFAKLVTERFETGRIYIMNVDTVNEQTPFYEPIFMSNLCQEITLPTTPMGDENSLIALCTLSALNWGRIQTDEEMAEAAEMAVRALDELLDYQNYPHEAAERHTRKYRPLGIGIIGLAHDMAKNFWTWGEDGKSLSEISIKMESMAYYLTKASADLALEKGPCPVKTKYSEGILPMDQSKLQGEWESVIPWDKLREQLRATGIRNSTLMALMPSESSSLISNETNGIEPPKSLITIKGNKEGNVTQVVPDFGTLAHAYETVWEVSTENYLKTVAELQRYVDQAISTNTSYDPRKGEITTTKLVSDILLAYKLGIKTLYYNNTRDGAGEEVDDGCESGACKL